MTDGVGSETYQYDILGRETGMTKTISGIAYPLAYSYNTASEVKQITYPSGRTVAQTVDALGRPTQVTSGSTNYVSLVNYNAAAQPTSYQYGNGVQAAFSYNAQMQLQSLAYSNSSGTIVGLTYNYGTGDNGQTQGITDSYDSGRSVNYTYDAWARLKTAQISGDSAYPAWGLSFSYDRYGNRTAQSVTTGSAPANSLSFSTAGGALTNHADTFSYDASGNMLNDGINTLTYDAENHALTSAGSLGSATYTYDGNGLRVEKSGSNGSTIYIFSGAKVVAEYAPGAQPSSPTTEYIYAGAELVASVASGTSTYYHPDQLSNRALTNSTGSVVGQQGHYPFGESWYASGTATKWKFTSYERDPESANDYAMARYDINRLGRFNSPDRLAGSIAAPQSLNRYSYVRNDPVNFVDPLGLYCAWDDGTFDDNPEDGGATQQQCDDEGGTWIDLPGPDVTSITVNGGNDQNDTGLSDLNTLIAGPVGVALETLAALLQIDPKCLQFLNSQNGDAVGTINTVLTNNLYGQEPIVPQANGNGTFTITNAHTGPGNFTNPVAITVNSIGAFYSSSFLGIPLTTDNGNIQGGTPAAQIFIVLHEVGHLTGVLQPDANNSAAGIQNNKNLQKNCAKTIGALSH
jgi:RHS repeat-associated protein